MIVRLALLLSWAVVAWCSDQTVAYVRPGGGVVVSDARGTILTTELVAWGPNWAWSGFEAQTTNERNAAVGKLVSQLGGNGGLIEVAVRFEQNGKQLILSYDVSAPASANTTYVVLGINPGARFSGAGAARIEEGTVNRAIDLPFGRGGIGQGVTAMAFGSAAETVRIAWSRPMSVGSDGQARVELVAGTLAAGDRRALKVTIDLPDVPVWYPTPADVPEDPAFATGFDWQPKQGQASGESLLDLSSWLDAPAGRAGRVVRKGDALLVAGKPHKFWGLNVCFANCAPPKDLAIRRAAMYARFGFNSVRLHKYADGDGWAGIQSKDSFTEFDPEALDRMDFFVAQLKERGIYVTLSPTFQLTLGEQQRKEVPYFDELGRMDGTRLRTGWGSVFLGHELQDLQIRQTINILKHRNPYTKLTYAEDPAVMAVEMFNEDDALFYGTMGQLQNSPTLRKRAGEAFTAWLTKKYGSEAGLLAAWGPQAINSFAKEGFNSESFAAQTIVPAGNPWFYDPDIMNTSQTNKRPRLLDTMRFLYETQNAFYHRFGEAMKAVGYQGEMISSNWQAGRAMSQFYNLHSDALIGLIDRHNYHNGTGSMLQRAGSSILSTGMQQVENRPFMVSEWIHCYPNEYGAEGPALIGAYGMGLQGWDSSFLFENSDDGMYAQKLGETWNVMTPNILGLSPAVARQVLRGDVTQSDMTVVRSVHIPSLEQGKMGFDDSIDQGGDVKSLDSKTISARALAVARMGVGFADTFKPTPAFTLPALRNGALVSSTGQLAWTEGTTQRSGFITIDSPGTKAVVGFAAGRTCVLGEVSITPRTPFAAIYLSAAGRTEDVRTAKRILVTAVARVRNTGMRMIDDQVMDQGKPPMRVEPVSARISITRPGKATVQVLDQDGIRTGQTIPMIQGTFDVDTAKTKSIYLEIAFE